MDSTLKKKVRLIHVPRSVSEHQVYIQSFGDAWIERGGEYTVRPKMLKNRLVKNVLKALSLAVAKKIPPPSGRAYLVCSRGQHLLKSSIPFNFNGEVIPMLWDCWPRTWKTLERDLRLLNVKVCFMTASDVVEHFSQIFPDIKFVHIPEGVDLTDYDAGKPLAERSIDVYEIGRKYQDYHQRLMDANLEKKCNFIYLNKKPDGSTFVFDTFQSYCQALSDSKINISFPSSITDADNAPVETLTMRYWEGMLSRCLIVGHCPRELRELLGYNPVIEADLDNPVAQLEDILSHISSYQSLVDRNREAALKIAAWGCRMKIVLECLENMGYSGC